MPSTSMRAFVTGASGYLGGRLVARLEAEGVETHVLTRPGSAFCPRASRIGVHEHDGTTSGLSAILAEVRPDVVFHLASLFIAEHAPADVEPLIRANVLFGTQLLEAMVAAGTRCLVNTGTAWQHFDDADYDPVGLYAATKQAFEAILAYYVNVHRLGALTLVLFDTYGPDDPRPKLVNLLKRIAERTEPLAMSPGEQRIDLVHADDVVEAFVVAGARLWNDGAPSDPGLQGHQVHAVSSGRPVRLRDLVAMYQEILGRPLPIAWGGRPYRVREVMVPWSRGTALPGWTARIDLRTGLSRLIDAEGGRERVR